MRPADDIVVLVRSGGCRSGDRHHELCGRDEFGGCQKDRCQTEDEYHPGNDSKCLPVPPWPRRGIFLSSLGAFVCDVGLGFCDGFGVIAEVEEHRAGCCNRGAMSTFALAARPL